MQMPSHHKILHHCFLGHFKLSLPPLFYNFSFGATKSSYAMLGMSAGINSSPTPWEEEMTALVGEQLSTFVKTGLPSGNMPKFGTDGEYIKGKDHSEFLLHNFSTSGADFVGRQPLGLCGFNKEWS